MALPAGVMTDAGAAGRADRVAAAGHGGERDRGAGLAGGVGQGHDRERDDADLRRERHGRGQRRVIDAATAVPLQFSGTVIVLKCSVPPRVMVIVAVIGGGGRGVGGLGGGGLGGGDGDDVFLREIVGERGVVVLGAPWVLAVVGSKPATFSAQSLRPSPSVSTSCTTTR